MRDFVTNMRDATRYGSESKSGQIQQSAELRRNYAVLVSDFVRHAQSQPRKLKTMNVFTVETRNGYTKWKLSPECQREIQPIADAFGMELRKFLYLYTLHALPGQLVRGNDVDEENTPPGFSVRPCADRATWDRIKRAARHDGLSIKDFVWQAVAGSVNCSEADMILSPATGDSISGDCMIEQFIVESERHEI